MKEFNLTTDPTDEFPTKVLVQGIDDFSGYGVSEYWVTLQQHSWKEGEVIAIGMPHEEAARLYHVLKGLFEPQV